MASLQVQMQAWLAGLAAGGSHYLFNEAATPLYPYITWMQIGGAPFAHLDGLADLRDARLQIDLFDTDLTRLLLTSETLRARAATSMAAEPGTAGLRLVPITEPQDLYEDAVRAYRRLHEFSVHWLP